MTKFTSGFLFLLFLIYSADACAAADNRSPNAYTQQSPMFYAALAEASYEKSHDDTQRRLNNILGRGVAQVLSRKRYTSTVFGSTNFILVKDQKGCIHVGIEGSNDVGNWVANSVMPIRGAITGYDVPEYIRRAMHKIIKKWEKNNDKAQLVSVVGHSQGGMYGSQLVHWKKDHYNESGTAVITFNCFKPKEEKNQLHFLVVKEHFVSLMSPSGRYIKISKSGKHSSIASNHGMKYFFRAFKDASWSDIR